jgi:hypothetical protein
VDLSCLWVRVPGIFALILPFSSLNITAGPAGTNLEVNVGAPLGSRKPSIVLMNSSQPFGVKFSCAFWKLARSPCSKLRAATTIFSITELDASRGAFCAVSWQLRAAIHSASRIFIGLIVRRVMRHENYSARLLCWQTYCPQRKLRCFEINNS